MWIWGLPFLVFWFFNVKSGFGSFRFKSVFGVAWSANIKGPEWVDPRTRKCWERGNWPRWGRGRGLGFVDLDRGMVVSRSKVVSVYIDNA